MEKNNLSKLQQLEMFFVCNLNIKNALVEVVLQPQDLYNEDAIITWSNKVETTLKYMREQFLVMASSMFGDYLVQKVDAKFNEYFQRLYDAGTNPFLIKRFYENSIYRIDPSFVQEVKSSCVGYSIFSGFYNLVEKDISINALAHVLHSSVMNNENIYQAVDLLDMKYNAIDEPISLRGDASNKLAVDLFTHFPAADIDCGITEIVALKDKIMIMVRDVGHATTIEMELNDDSVLVRYFIPKLCNIDMINELPGINKVASDAPINSGARGTFISSKENAIIDIYNFINMVPQDRDIKR